METKERLARHMLSLWDSNLPTEAAKRIYDECIMKHAKLRKTVQKIKGFKNTLPYPN